MNNQQTPMLFPIAPEEVWQKIRELVRSELQRAKDADDKPVSYEVPGMVKKPLYRPYEVCAMLGVTRQTVHTWVKEGLLKQYKVKSRAFFLAADIERLIKNDGT